MKYIEKSLERYLIQQKWHLGDYASRVGHPFTWADTGAKPLIMNLDELNSLLHFYCMYYVEKKTPSYIRTNRTSNYKKKLDKIFNFNWDTFFKYLDKSFNVVLSPAATL